jgi:hypothetical protein
MPLTEYIKIFQGLIMSYFCTGKFRRMNTSLQDPSKLYYIVIWNKYIFFQGHKYYICIRNCTFFHNLSMTAV